VAPADVRLPAHEVHERLPGQPRETRQVGVVIPAAGRRRTRNPRQLLSRSGKRVEALADTQELLLRLPTQLSQLFGNLPKTSTAREQFLAGQCPPNLCSFL